MAARTIINTDFKPRSLRDRSSIDTRDNALQIDQHWRLRSLLLASGFAVLGIVLASTDENLSTSAQSEFSAVELPALTVDAEPAQDIPTLPEIVEEPSISVDYYLEPENQLPELAEVEPEQQLIKWRKVVVKSGDTISTIFKRQGFHDQYVELFKNKTIAKQLRRIHPGQAIHLGLGNRGLEELKMQPNQSEQLHIVRNDDGDFEATLTPLDFEKRIQLASGQITHSLFLAGRDAGLSGKMIMQMASILGWDIDFSLDVRRGDRFNVIYEQRYRDEKPIGDAEILAAEYVNRGKVYRAYRHSLQNGETDYFTEDGRSVRKAFLRSPVNFARISSHFNLQRRHPILNRIRAHKGVDYAARSGTPIMAAGDGKIIFRGRKGGYGNTVIIQHGSAYSTLYGHMSRFKSGQRTGSRVRQGDIVGYVGSSGLATGPHLHYEFRINGVHRNPVTVELPKAEPLPKEELAAFKTSIQPLQARMDLFHRKLAAAGADDAE